MRKLWKFAVWLGLSVLVLLFFYRNLQSEVYWVTRRLLKSLLLLVDPAIIVIGDASNFRFFSSRHSLCMDQNSVGLIGIGTLLFFLGAWLIHTAASWRKQILLGLLALIFMFCMNVFKLAVLYFASSTTYLKSHFQLGITLSLYIAAILTFLGLLFRAEARRLKRSSNAGGNV